MSAINEDELKARLDPLSYEVLRNGATERPFTGEYTDTDKVGSYRCKACSAELFKSETKFHSGCGWPSFYAPTADDAVVLIEDRSLPHEFAQKYVVQIATHTLAMFLRAKAMKFLPIKDGALILWHSSLRRNRSRESFVLNFDTKIHRYVKTGVDRALGTCFIT